MPPRNSCRDMRFHVDSHSTDRPMERGLLRRSRHQGIDAEQQPLGRSRQATGKPVGPLRVGRYRFAGVANRIGHDPVARSQSGLQPSGDANTDNAGHTAGELIERCFQSHMIAAAGNGLNARSGKHAPFPFQSGDREDHHMP
jgi:hypothetical protein